LANTLVAGPEAAVFSTPLWTLDRVAKVIRRQFRAAFGRPSRSARVCGGLLEASTSAPTLCARDLWSLPRLGIHGLRRIRRERHRLIVAFYKPAEIRLLDVTVLRSG
jgi:hypothetical protein